MGRGWKASQALRERDVAENPDPVLHTAHAVMKDTQAAPDRFFQPYSNMPDGVALLLLLAAHNGSSAACIHVPCFPFLTAPVASPNGTQVRTPAQSPGQEPVSAGTPQGRLWGERVWPARRKQVYS